MEGGADLFHRRFLGVVEDDDESRGAAEALGKQLFEVAPLDLPQRAGLAPVLDHVNFANLAVAVGVKAFA